VGVIVVIRGDSKLEDEIAQLGQAFPEKMGAIDGDSVTAH
jgi:hypothetical protein